jgi:hypothetical protein
MASLFMVSCKLFLFIILSFSFNLFFFVTSTEYEVGGDHGWVVPKPKDDQMYNQWASKHRFIVNDTIRKYQNISKELFSLIDVEPTKFNPLTYYKKSIFFLTGQTQVYR